MFVEDYIGLFVIPVVKDEKLDVHIALFKCVKFECKQKSR